MGNFLNKKSHEKPNIPDDMTDGMADEHKKVATPYSFWSGEAIFVMGIVLFAFYALIDASNHSFLGAIFPLLNGSVMLLLGILLLYKLFSPKSQANTLYESVTVEGKLSLYWIDTWKNFLWIISLVIATALIGFIPALFILFISLIKAKTNSSWYKTLFISLCAIGFLIFVSQIMVLHLPNGFIFDLFDIVLF